MRYFPGGADTASNLLFACIHRPYHRRHRRRKIPHHRIDLLLDGRRLWAEGVLTMLAMTGEFRPSGFLLGMFVSPGGLVPLLIFLLVALRVSKRRQSLPTR